MTGFNVNHMRSRRATMIHINGHFAMAEYNCRRWFDRDLCRYDLDAL